MPDVPAKSLKLNLTPTKLTFTGTSETKKTTYHLELEFYGEIDVENSKTHHTAANIQMVLRKKDLKAEYWPRLLKSDKKVHFLRTDFDKVRSCMVNLRTLYSYISSGLMRMNKTRRPRTTT